MDKRGKLIALQGKLTELMDEQDVPDGKAALETLRDKIINGDPEPDPKSESRRGSFSCSQFGYAHGGGPVGRPFLHDP